MLVRTMQEGQAAQAEQMRKQQAATAAQLLFLQSLGELPSFSGKGSDTTLIANEWLQRSEDYFSGRELAMGIDAPQGDKSRMLNAASALRDDAAAGTTRFLRNRTHGPLSDSLSKPDSAAYQANASASTS